MVVIESIVDSILSKYCKGVIQHISVLHSASKCALLTTSNARRAAPVRSPARPPVVIKVTPPLPFSPQSRSIAGAQGSFSSLRCQFICVESKRERFPKERIHSKACQFLSVSCCFHLDSLDVIWNKDEPNRLYSGSKNPFSH